MYGNDYSWVPSFFAGLLALAALGGLLISLIKTDTIRFRIFKAWLLMPALLSMGLGVVAAIFGKNLEPYSPILFVPVFAIILLPPWLIAACPVYGFARYLQAKVRRRRFIG